MKMRESLVRFRSLVHMYINRKQYIKVHVQNLEPQTNDQNKDIRFVPIILLLVQTVCR